MKLSVLMPTQSLGLRFWIAFFSTLISLPKNSELVLQLTSDVAEANRFIRSFKKVRIVLSGQELSLPEALNSMLLESKGALIARMDSDDVCLPWRFFLKSRQDVDFMFYSTLVSSKSSLYLPIPQFPYSLTHTQISILNKHLNLLAHPTMICRREAILEMGGYSSVSQEDWDLWTRSLGSNFKFHKSAVPVIIYSIHSRQKSSPESTVSKKYSATFTIAEYEEVSRGFTRKIEKLMFMLHCKIREMGPY